MNMNYKYYIFNNKIYVRLNIQTQNFQFLNNEKMWEDNNSFKDIFEKTNSFTELKNENTIKILEGFPSKINEVPQITQEEFDKLSDIDKLNYMAIEARRTNKIFENQNNKK